MVKVGVTGNEELARKLLDGLTDALFPRIDSVRARIRTSLPANAVMRNLSLKRRYTKVILQLVVSKGNVVAALLDHSVLRILIDLEQDFVEDRARGRTAALEAGRRETGKQATHPAVFLLCSGKLGGYKM